MNQNGDIITNPKDIANEIYSQQTITNKPTVPTCYHQTTHAHNCTCNVRQYPWHDLDGCTLEKRGAPHIPLHTYFNKQIYDLSLKNLSNNKAPGPDRIPKSILKNMPQSFHKLLHLFFTHCYKQKQIYTLWKNSITILLYKKRDPYILTNH